MTDATLSNLMVDRIAKLRERKAGSRIISAADDAVLALLRTDGEAANVAVLEGRAAAQLIVDESPDALLTLVTLGLHALMHDADTVTPDVNDIGVLAARYTAAGGE